MFKSICGKKEAHTEVVAANRRCIPMKDNNQGSSPDSKNTPKLLEPTPKAVSPDRKGIPIPPHQKHPAQDTSLPAAFSGQASPSKEGTQKTETQTSRSVSRRSMTTQEHIDSLTMQIEALEQKLSESFHIKTMSTRKKKTKDSANKCHWQRKCHLSPRLLPSSPFHPL